MEEVFEYQAKPATTKITTETVLIAAEAWINSDVPILIRLGKQAQERLQDGEDPNTVLTDMLNRYDAFKLAQEG